MCVYSQRHLIISHGTRVLQIFYFRQSVGVRHRSQMNQHGNLQLRLILRAILFTLRRLSWALASVSMLFSWQLLFPIGSPSHTHTYTGLSSTKNSSTPPPCVLTFTLPCRLPGRDPFNIAPLNLKHYPHYKIQGKLILQTNYCLLYTSDAADECRIV